MEARSSALVRRGATAALSFLLLLTQSAVGRAQDWNAAVQQDLVKEPVVGLLNLPDVVGSDCATNESAGPTLFAGPSRAGATVGTMIWSTDCRVLVKGVGTDAAEELPTAESGYETPAAVVLQRVGPWFRIARQQGAAWIVRDDLSGFLPYPELLRETLAYLRKGWDGMLWGSPGAARTRPLPPRWAAYRDRDVPIEFIGARLVDRQVWIQVRLLADSCGVVLEGVTPLTGWLPAYRPSGAPSVWFYARGC